MGDPLYFWGMFIRKKKNTSGSISIQILSKIGRKNKLLKTVGCARTKREEELLMLLAKTEKERLEGMQSLFVEHDDLVVESFVNSIANDHLQIVGTELILGKIYKKIGFPECGCPDYFRNLVLCRIVYPGSKLKTVKYFKDPLWETVKQLATDHEKISASFLQRRLHIGFPRAARLYDELKEEGLIEKDEDY